GAVFTVAASATLLAFPAAHATRPPHASRAARMRRWLVALLPLAAPIAVPLLLRLLSGSALSSTAHVKLLIGNPYYTGSALWAAVQYNAKLLFVTLLDGKIWSAEFLPPGGTIVGVIGLAAVVALGVREERRWRAL